jgi:hypothetical protein
MVNNIISPQSYMDSKLFRKGQLFFVVKPCHGFNPWHGYLLRRALRSSRKAIEEKFA